MCEQCKYEDWIQNWLKENNALENGGYGLCSVAAEQMAQEFPFLTVVRGHVDTPWGKRGHWWLTTEDGTIVDPTAAQFPGIFKYEEYNEGDPVRLGKCMNCGEEIWGPSPEAVYSTCMCNDECGKAFEAYLNKDLNL